MILLLFSYSNSIISYQILKYLIYITIISSSPFSRIQSRCLVPQVLNPSFIIFSIIIQQKPRNMSKWDEEFDLDDFDAKPSAKKNKDAKKPKIQEDDFFDLDDEVAPKASKLPTIAKKQPQSIPAKDKNTKKSTNVYDDYEQIYEEVEQAKSPVKNISKVPVQESNYYEQIQDFQQVKPNKDKKGLKTAAQPPKEQEIQEFYQSVQQIKSPATKNQQISPSPTKKAPAPTFELSLKESDPEDYEEHFDDYGQDFEEEVKEHKHSPKKSNTSANLKPKDKNSGENSVQKKKYTVNTNQIFTNKVQKDPKNQPSIPKPPQSQSKNPSKKTIETKIPVRANHGLSQPPKPIQKSVSRKSLKSNDSRIANSRVSKKYTTEFTSNKHMLMVQKKFPEDEFKIRLMTIEKLSRVNENIRDMIRKFNEELNQLINKNMILLKEKPLERQRNMDQKVKVLQEQLKSGATVLEVVENEYEKLIGRQGELKEEEYLLIMEKKIEEVREQSKETSKLITKLKYEVNNEGNKLSRQDVQKKMAQELHQIKSMLIQVKKEEEKYEGKLQKLQKMSDQLQGKNNDKQYELSEQIDTAKEKGIAINVNEVLVKKYEELKAKVINNQNHGKALQSLYKNKCEVISHENDQSKIAIRNVESQVKNVMHSIEYSQEESTKTIMKAKENPKISPQMIESLDKLLKSIEENQNSSYFDVRSEGNKSQASERPLKKSMYQNIHKEKPSRNSASKKDSYPPKPQEPRHDEINLMKPNFMKKKEKASIRTEQDDTNRLYQGVWKEEEEEKKRENERKKEEAKKIEEEEAKKLLEAEQIKKKPFSLKKNRLNNNEKSFEQTPEANKNLESPVNKLESPVSEVPKEEQQKILIKPKFTRFNKPKIQNKNDLSTEQPPLAVVADEPKKIVVEQTPREISAVHAQKDEEAPIFVPKRFNLRNKIEKKQDSYIPSIEKAEEKKPEPEPQIRLQLQNKYAPSIPETQKIEVREEEAYKPTRLETKKIENQPKIVQGQEKPKFMLKLKDRQKKETTENNDYVPTRMTEVDVSQKQKIVGEGYSPSTKENRKEDSYAPSFKRAEKENIISPKQNKLDILPKDPVNNPYAPKPPVSNPYAHPVQEEKVVVNNPYAQRDESLKKERQGPVKKIKIQNKVSKQKFNIYEQAEDITEPSVQPLNIPTNEPVNQKPVYNVNLAKTDELDLHEMLGIKKKEKPNDLNDLLEDVKVDKKKQRKKNTDFFNDLDL